MMQGRYAAGIECLDQIKHTSTYIYVIKKSQQLVSDIILWPHDALKEVNSI